MFRLVPILCSLIVLAGHSFAETASDNETMFRAEMDVSFCYWPHPWPVSRVQPQFRVYLRDGATTNFTIESETEVNASVAELERVGYFGTGRPVVFIVHGFRDIINSSYILRIREGLLALGDFTIILTGWEQGAYLSVLEYPQAASNTQTAARVIASLSRAILHSDTFQGNKDRLYLYCIGFSLGAHVCGQAGLDAVGLFDRITGLDPAGPGFENCPSNPSLLPQSADCVDSIHTDGNYSGHIDPIIPHQGALRRWGFVDFYPNGGVNQPGCDMFTNDFRACSHLRAVQLFIYSLRKPRGVCSARGPCAKIKPLPDRSCDESGLQQLMGYYSTCHMDVRRSDRRGGVYYIPAAATDPYC